MVNNKATQVVVRCEKEQGRKLVHPTREMWAALLRTTSAFTWNAMPIGLVANRRERWQAPRWARDLKEL